MPRYLPNTNQVNTLNSLGEMLLPVIEANKGRCFVLCTSYSMMRGLAEYFREKVIFRFYYKAKPQKANYSNNL